MKKIIVLILFIPALLFAQTDCKNQVSTDPSNPTNNSLPYTNNAYDDDYFLNGFDWLNVNGSGSYLPYNMTNINNGSGLPISQMDNIMVPPSGGYYDYLINSKLVSLENGWELLLANLGRILIM